MSDFGNVRLTPACIGMLADTSDYNIDGACVVAPGRRAYFGTAVSVVGIVDGVKLVATVQDGELPFGVAMNTALTPRLFSDDAPDYPYVEEGEPISVVSHGRIWCVTSQTYDPQPMEKLKIGNGFISPNGSYSSGWVFAGGKFNFNSESNLIEVQVLQNSNKIAEPPEPEES